MSSGVHSICSHRKITCMQTAYILFKDHYCWSTISYTAKKKTHKKKLSKHNRERKQPGCEALQRSQSNRHARRSAILPKIRKADVLGANFWTTLIIGQSAKLVLHIQPNLCTSCRHEHKRRFLIKEATKRLQAGLWHTSGSVYCKPCSARKQTSAQEGTSVDFGQLGHKLSLLRYLNWKL